MGAFFYSIGKYKSLNAARKQHPMQLRRYEQSEFSCIESVDRIPLKQDLYVPPHAPLPPESIE